MQAFARKMAVRLLDVSDDSVSSNPSLVSLQRWSLECSGLAICFCLWQIRQLARERASILQQVDTAEPSGQPSQPMPFNLGFRHTADKLTEIKELADQLCANRAEESRTYMYSIVCLYPCVSLFPYSPFSSIYRTSLPLLIVKALA